MENVTLSDIHKELLHLEKKVDRLEHILIPEVEATEKDRKGLEAAMKEYAGGKTVSFRSLKKG